MADDQNQRPYRASEVSARGNGGSSGNDPLAELARLIGQNDPFAEYGRHNASGAAPQAPEAAGWPADNAAYSTAPTAADDHAAYADEQPYGAPRQGRPAFGGVPLAAGNSDLYQVDAHAPGYETQGYDPAAYPDEAYADAAYQGRAVPGYENAFPPSQEPFHDVHEHFGPGGADDYYDDVAPSRRRISIMAIAGVFALAVLGTAGAFGYRALFGPSSAPRTPPVIKADATPSKVVPDSANKDTGKSITDRVGSNGQIEKLLSREEQPVPVTTTPNQAPASEAAFPPKSGNAAATGTGIVGEPKKVRTIAIHPDQANETAGVPAAAEPPRTQAQAPVRVINTARVAEPPPKPVIPEPARPAPVTHTAAPQPEAPAPAPRQVAQPANAPLSLNPNAAPARAPRVASAPVHSAPAAAAGGGGYAVQVSAQRSEADAQAAFQSLQGKFPNQLGGRQPLIKRVDLGAKGIYYRALVGPFGSSSEAAEFCSGLKAAGGQCLIQRN